MAPSADFGDGDLKDQRTPCECCIRLNHASKSEKILHQMNEFRKHGLLCDVTLTCDDGKELQAHKLVLASTSPYFRAMFHNEMLEKSQTAIAIRGVSSESMQTLIDHAYNSTLHLDLESIWDLLQAANMLCFEDVERDCVEYLSCHLDMDNCVDIYEIAESIDSSQLRILAGMYVTKNFRPLVKSSAFLRLSWQQLACILNSDSLNVSSEAEVFEAVLTWTKYDQSNRKGSLISLLHNVRLVFLSRKFLVDRVMKEPLLMDDNDCRELILQALDYHLLPERREQYSTLSTIPRKFPRRQLVVLGGEANHQPLQTGECFDFATETWTSISPMIMARKHVAVVSLDGDLYALGGVNNDYQDLVTVEKYDVDNEVWNQVASLTKCKGAISVVAEDGWLYVAGGSCHSLALKTVERYDPFKNTWTEVTSMRLPRSHFGLVAMRGKIYAVGGYCGISEVEHCEYFDPHTSKWTEITGMNKSRMNHGVVAHEDRIYAIGGSSSLGPLNSIEKYNPDLNMWLVIKNCISLRQGVAVACSCRPECDKQELVIVGGKDSTCQEQREVQKLFLRSPDYDVMAMPSMMEKRIHPGLCLL